MPFKDHLKVVTDAGAVLHLGWDYDAPLLSRPAERHRRGLENRAGCQSGGRHRGGAERLRRVPHPRCGVLGRVCAGQCPGFQQKLPYFTKGTLYFSDHYFTRFVLQKTPYFSSYTPQPRCSLMLYSEKPFWYDLNAVSSVLGGYEKAFRFPVCYDSHIYGIKRDGTAAVLRNEGQPAGALHGHPAVRHAGDASQGGGPADRGLHRL